MKVRRILRKLSESSLAKGFGITLVGSGLSKTILMFATFLFTHLLSKEDFGSFSFIRNTLNIIFCISALNFVGLVTKFTAETQYKPESKSRIVLLFAFSFLVCVLIGFGLLVLPESMLDSIVGINSLNGYFRAIGLLLPMFMLQPLIEGVFRGMKLFMLIGILQTSTAIMFVVFIGIGAYLYGVDGAVMGLLMYYFLYALISVLIFFKKLSVKRVFNSLTAASLKSQSSILWIMVLPVFILSFVEAPINWWAQVLMTKYDTIGAVGSMSAILQIRNLLIIVPNYFFSTFTTFQATLNAKGDQIKYFANMKKVFWGCLIVGICFTAILSLFGSPLLGLYGGEYQADLNGLYIAMISFPFMIAISLLRSNLLIKEHQRLMLVTSIVASFIQIGVMYWLLPIGLNPVQAYFWSQFGYSLIVFMIFGICTLKDASMARILIFK